MKIYQTNDIRNIALVGGAKSGKTTMAEAMAFNGGVINRRGTVEDKNTISDYRDIELDRRNSVNTSLLYTEFGGKKINILDTNGNLDLDEEYIDRLDIVIAGIHWAWYKGGTKEENTQGLINVIRHPKMHIISHPGDGSAELDFEPLVMAAKEAHTLLEINNHSLAPQRHKTIARDNNLEILRFCKKYEVPTILGSDAHVSFQIADYTHLYPLLAETDFPEELIMNYWPKKFFEYLGIETSTP